MFPPVTFHGAQSYSTQSVSIRVTCSFLLLISEEQLVEAQREMQLWKNETLSDFLRKILITRTSRKTVILNIVDVKHQLDGKNSRHQEYLRGKRNPRQIIVTKGAMDGWMHGWMDT